MGYDEEDLLYVGYDKGTYYTWVMMRRTYCTWVMMGGPTVCGL